MSASRHRQFRVAAGQDLSLNVRSWGHGELFALLIHGFGEGGFVWNTSAPHLAELGQVIAVDLRGHGASSWSPDGRYDVALHVRDVLEVLCVVGTPPLVIGHSMGAEIALQLVASRKLKPRGLVIVDFAPKVNNHAVGFMRSQFAARFRRYTSPEEYSRELERFLPLADQSTLASLAGHSLKRQADGAYELCCDPALTRAPGRAEDEELSHLFRAVPCPTLLIRGQGSSVLPHAAAVALTQMIPRAELRTVSASGHAVMVDNPDEFLSAIFPFALSVQEPT